ncbi:MAG: DUF2852 domain-containing protein [Burkholderiaceae bacterium]
MSTTSNPSEAAVEPLSPFQRHDGCRQFTPLRIAMIVVGFLVFWPIGLALLVWTIWRDQIRETRVYQKLSSCRGRHSGERSHRSAFMARRPSNSALASYLEREQDRLKAEQEKLAELVKAFEAFKDAESRSADQRDFDAFLRQRDGEQAD